MKTYLIKDNSGCWYEWPLEDGENIDDLLISYLDSFCDIKRESLVIILEHLPLQESVDVINALIEDYDYKIWKIVELGGVLYCNDES